MPKSDLAGKSVNEIDSESFVSDALQLLPEAEALYSDAEAIMASAAGQQAVTDVKAFAASVMKIIGPVFHLS